MSESASSETGLTIHPLLATIAAAAADESAAQEAPVKLSGYVGRASQEGAVRLYSTLKNLSFYIEFPNTAVVRVAQAPASLLPDDAVSVWVNASTPIHWVTEYRTATEFHARVHRAVRRKARTKSN